MKPGYKILAVIGIIAVAHTVHKKEVERFEHDMRQSRITYEALLTAQEVRLKDYFAAHGSPEPVNMAKAVTKSKRKHLASAIAVKESNGNPKAVGDHGASKGAWQVQGKHWKRVPKTAEAQVRQHDWVMDQLEAEFNMPKAVEKYNGSGPAAKRYKKEVVSEAIRLAQEIGE